MKLKTWLVRLGVGLIVAALGPIILAAAVALVPGSTEVTVSALLAGEQVGLTLGVYLLLALSILVLVLIYQAILQPLLGRIEEDDREEGLVKWFNVSKGFGFVTRDNGEDVFVHFRSIRGRGHRSLQEGQRVRFGVVESSKGLQAEDVTIVRQR
ncbi:cold-shock protein [Reinekea blandensis]|uniref:Cold shock protein n=1 Tax=Reinekea blandensis MED297 TaxID=314283 RepID=A4BC11_9GAMM|nr:cold-shock protein [Reinekea blandensis]EAR10496.1 Cold shock protein [Reinekea sp. MED297] [Reinekea blandensis MED297]